MFSPALSNQQELFIHALNEDMYALNLVLTRLSDELVDYDLPLNELFPQDKEGNTLFHVLAKHGKEKIFYHLLNFIKKFDPTHFPLIIKNLINHRGETPWRVAIENEQALFFNEPIKSEEKEIWCALNEAWLDVEDNEGNTILHALSSYPSKASRSVIKFKKNILRLLLAQKLNVNKRNKKGKTAIHLAAEIGSFETSKELLDNDEIDLTILDNNLESPFALTEKNGHQKIADLMLSTAKRNKIKDKFISRLFNLPSENKPPLLYAAENIHLSDDDFLKRLKLAGKIDFHFDGKNINVIDLRIETFKRKYRLKHIKIALLSSLCPASSFATTIGFLGGFNPEPLTASIIATAILPVIYIPFVYACYKARSREYSTLKAESLHLKWLALHLSGLQKEYEAMLQALKTVTKKINSSQSLDELEYLINKKNRLAKKFKELLNHNDQYFTDNSKGQKLKYKFKYFSADKKEFNRYKMLAANDPKAHADWVGRAESIRAFFAAKADILCPVGAGVTIASSIAAIVFSKVGVGFLGAAGAAFFTGPVGPIVAGILLTLALTVVIGFVIYKTSFKQEKAEMGKLNSELIGDYTECKQAQKKLLNSRKQIQSQLEKIETKVAAQRNNFTIKKQTNILLSDRLSFNFFSHSQRSVQTKKNQTKNHLVF